METRASLSIFLATVKEREAMEGKSMLGRRVFPNSRGEKKMVGSLPKYRVLQD
jgi:hypothetical protein